MRVLVCGGRGYGELPAGIDPHDERYWIEVDVVDAERQRVVDMLRPLWVKGTLALIIEGGAKGADRLAREWARDYSIPVKTFAADWEQHGRAAGPIRNARMISEGKPDLVIAFPGGKGTADMVRRAREAGIPVTEVSGSGRER